MGWATSGGEAIAGARTRVELLYTMDERQQPEDDGEPTLEGCFAPDGTDLTLIQSALEMTPGERLQAAQAMIDFVALARGAED